MPLPSGSLRAFFAYQLQPRFVAKHAKTTSDRLSKLRRGHLPPTAHEIALLAIAFGESYDAVWDEFKAVSDRKLEAVRQPARA